MLYLAGVLIARVDESSWPKKPKPWGLRKAFILKPLKFNSNKFEFPLPLKGRVFYNQFCIGWMPSIQ